VFCPALPPLPLAPLPALPALPALPLEPPKFSATPPSSLEHESVDESAASDIAAMSETGAMSRATVRRC
jgi:hypothetical protein